MPMPIIKLGDGTQEMTLREAVKAVCRCSRKLAWKFLDDVQLSAEAECECGMDYTAWQPVITVKIEGTNRE